MTTHNPHRTRGFTLVEMLVVMAIIAILAAILLPAINSSIRAAKNNRIAQEISQLHQAIENYKNKFGDYPPDFQSITKIADLTDNNNVVVRHFRKAFPRHTENLTNVFAPGGKLNVPDPSEALVLWLSLLKNDPRLPLTGTAERIVLFPFDESRLKDLNGNAWNSYVPKDGKDTPYVYFDNRTYVFNNGANYSSFTHNGVTVCPYKTSTNPTPPNFANPTTFQIISAGLDGDYGTTTVPNYKVFPDGTNYVVGSGDMDNLTNFSDGRILEDHMP